mmetsp:Transcript_31698/g.48551  ORF Transcript_31698/g.48551 Transcript_31698/m.48551 type:complete len:95 (+) Transcript_31698:1296-1580(+)
MSYDYNSFKNSLWENFVGSMYQVSYLQRPDASRNYTHQYVDKMGPVLLRVEEGNLYQAWEKSRQAEVGDFKSDVPGEKKMIESWVCRPPNAVMF